MSKEQFFIGCPCEFKLGILVYPPTVKEVISNRNYGIYYQILTYSQEDIEDEFLSAEKTMEVYPTPLEFLLNNSYHNEIYAKKAQEAFEFFLHQKVTFLYDLKKIVIGDLEEVLGSIKNLNEIILLGEDEFFDFQNMIRQSVGKKSIEPPIQEENPRIREIKRKARQRDRLKAKQASNGQGGISLFTMIASICCMGIGITPLNIGEMSYMAIESIFNLYQDKEKYELDIDSLLAGADSKKIKPQYWIRNFEN